MYRPLLKRRLDFLEFCNTLVVQDKSLVSGGTNLRRNQRDFRNIYKMPYTVPLKPYAATGDVRIHANDDLDVCCECDVVMYVV